MADDERASAASTTDAEASHLQDGPSETRSASRSRRPTEPLPSGRISFRNQLNILRAYAVASGPSREPVNYKDAGELAAVAASTLRLNNSFFSEVGFLKKAEGGGYIPSDAVVAFQTAHEWDENTAPEKLAPVLRDSWFGKALIPRLTMKPLKTDRAIQVLAEACGATPDYENQLSMLLEYLEVASLIERDGDMISKGPLAHVRRADHAQTSPEEEEPEDEEEEEEPPSPPARSGLNTGFQAPQAGAIKFHVDVTVDMDEMAGWEADRITAFFNGVAQVLAAKGRMEKSMTE